MLKLFRNGVVGFIDWLDQCDLAVYFSATAFFASFKELSKTRLAAQRIPKRQQFQIEATGPDAEEAVKRPVELALEFGKRDRDGTSDGFRRSEEDF